MKNKKELYESIMKNVAKAVKKQLNENTNDDFSIAPKLHSIVEDNSGSHWEVICVGRLDEWDKLEKYDTGTMEEMIDAGDIDVNDILLAVKGTDNDNKGQYAVFVYGQDGARLSLNVVDMEELAVLVNNKLEELCDNLADKNITVPKVYMTEATRRFILNHYYGL